MSSVLCLGPQGLPHTGQSIATDTWVSLSKWNITRVNNNFEGLSNFKRLLRTLLLPVLIFRAAYKIRPATMYLSLKRSLFGAIADFACVMIYRSIVRGSVVVHLHGADLKDLRRTWFGDLLIRKIWNYVTDVIILSPNMSEQLEGLPIKNIHTIKNFSEKFNSKKSVKQKANKFCGKFINILYLSNIMYSKGFTYLIEAVRILRAEGKNVTLTLAGQPLGDNIMSASQVKLLLDAQISEGIIYLGVINGIEKWIALDEAHVIALPTFYKGEAQPISLLEGMAFGCIPLTTRHNYNEDFLDSKSVMYVDKKNVDAIAEALRELLANPNKTALRMLSSLNHVIKNHSLIDYIDGVDKVINCTIKKKAYENNNAFCAEEVD